MNIHKSENLILEENGWELRVKEGQELSAKTGDLVKISISSVSPLDFEKKETIRSVSYEDIWVKIIEGKDGRWVGELKTQPGYELVTKDGTVFKIGDKINFANLNILEIR